jgi:hypothetical protein
VVLKARRGGVSIEEARRFLYRPLPVRIMAASAISRKAITRQNGTTIWN